MDWLRLVENRKGRSIGTRQEGRKVSSSVKFSFVENRKDGSLVIELGLYV